MESQIFLSENRDGITKGWVCANRITQRSDIPREKTSIPKVTTESILAISLVDSKQEREAVSMDIPNVFVQTKVPQGAEIIIMKIWGALVDTQLEIDSENTKTSWLVKAEIKFCERRC